MQHRRPSQSEISPYIRGIENVHCALPNPGNVRGFYEMLFGPPVHTDGQWTEFKISGFDLAVTQSETSRFVITFKVEGLEELREILEGKLSAVFAISHGDYGDYIEVCPDEGFCIHFFESRK